MKSENCNSTILFLPQIESPIAVSIIDDSHIGVFLILSFPNFFKNPSVTLNTPPYSAISCPMIIKSLYFSIDNSRAFEIESTNLISFNFSKFPDFVFSKGCKTSLISFVSEGTIFDCAFAFLISFSITWVNFFLIFTISFLFKISESNRKAS